MSNPVHDLTYRNYDGPMLGTDRRWWPIAKAQMSKVLKNRWLWVCMMMGGWYYFVMMVIIFIMEQVASAGGPQGSGAMNNFIGQLIWKDQFVIGFSYGQLIFLIMAWIIGSGSIANDNRANALLVYLSKPCSKLEYVFGKWLGIFLPLLLLQAIPGAFFYLYGALSWTDYGFIKSDPSIPFKMLILLPLSASLHASLILGISSLFKQGRLAGATYAGVYFLSNWMAQIAVILYQIQLKHRGIDGISSGVKTLYYSSVDGIQIGLAKLIFGTHGSTQFGLQSPVPPMRMPGSWWPLLVWAILTGFGFWIAWRKVQAVEVSG